MTNKSQITKPKSKTVLILGGGLTGLTAGVELSRSGWQVTVLESEPEVGGLARTFKKDNFKFDTGPHRWFTKMKYVDQWMDDIFVKDFIQVKRLTRIYFDKKFFFYPMRLENLKRLGLGKAFYILIDYSWHRIKNLIKPMQVKTMEEAYIEQFGPQLYKTFFKRYSEKLWGHPCSELSGDWVSQRSKRMSLFTVIKDLFFKSKGKVVSLVDAFKYPRQGIGFLSQKMSQIIQKNQGQVLVNAKVIKIKRKNNQIVSVIAQTKKGQKEFSADQVISTISLPNLVNSFQPKLAAKITQAADKLEFRASVQVTLFLKKDKIIPDTWLYVHPLYLSFVRFMPMDNWNPQLSPKGKTAIVFELICGFKDKIWTMPKNKVVDLVTGQFINEFKQVLDIRKKDIIGGFVKRLTHEYPVYLPGYKKQLKTIKNELKKITNLQLAGRNGIFRYNNMDHSVAMGLYAAWNLTKEGFFDIENINTEQEYHEEKKVK